MSQDQFFESLEMSNKSLKTALACLAPEEGGSEGARYKTLLYFTYKYFKNMQYKVLCCSQGDGKSNRRYTALV